jgi:hypothetical protein
MLFLILISLGWQVVDTPCSSLMVEYPLKESILLINSNEQHFVKLNVLNSNEDGDVTFSNFVEVISPSLHND